MGGAISSAKWFGYGAVRAPATFWMDWVLVNSVLIKRQLGAAVSSLGKIGPISWIWFQVETYRLLWEIEVNHLMETALDNRLGRSETFSTALPHVDTSFVAKPWWVGVAAFFLRGKSGGSQSTMMAALSGPVIKEVVLVGGGHSHAFVIKNFGMRPEPGVRVTLISNEVETPYSGMLPGHVAGLYSREECHIDLGRLCKFGNVRFIVGTVCKVDRDSKLIYVEGDRPPIRYDVMSIDIGSSPRMDESLLNSKELQPTPVKPISGFSQKWMNLLETVTSSKKQKLSIAVVGAGAGGVELALSMQHRVNSVLEHCRQTVETRVPTVDFILISNKNHVCPSHNRLVQQKFLRILNERKVKVVFDFHVTEVRGCSLLSQDGRSVEADEVLWCTNAKTQAWIGEAGFAVDDGGFIRVHDTLESENTRDVFGAGDCANVVPHPRPKAGVFAVRQGPPLSENIRRSVRRQLQPKNKNNDLLPFQPQTTFLGIIGAGDGYCVASRGEMALEGRWIWDLKDWIDRKWMAGYSSQLPVMTSSHDDLDGSDDLEKLTKASLMRCGGCGAKVGKTVLERVMENLHPPTRDEILIGLDAPDDCAVVAFDKAHPESKVVQTVDFFRSFIDDPYVFGQVAANHALSDCHAMCSQPVAAMAIAVVPFASSKIVEGDLTQMMAGACDMLRKSNCALVGGHSCEGTELALGLSVSGTQGAGERLLTKGGVRDGDVIIVTKPIGTGVVFAADMRVLSRGIWVKKALESMLRSNQTAGVLARDYDATACTDITGFGLVGHLIEIMNASDPGLVASLEINSVPLLEGALDCVRAGVFSSLQPENHRLKHAIINQNDAVTFEKYPLLFDPQTAGGLLITVPNHRSKELISALKKSGVETATVVGSVSKAADSSLGKIRIC